jgi:hypothetical protein
MQHRISAQPAMPLAFRRSPMSRKPNSAAKTVSAERMIAASAASHSAARPPARCSRCPPKPRRHRQSAAAACAHAGQGDRFGEPGAEQTDQSADQELPAGDQERRGDALGDAADKKHMQGPEEAAGDHPQVADHRLDALAPESSQVPARQPIEVGQTDQCGRVAAESARPAAAPAAHRAR